MTKTRMKKRQLYTRPLFRCISRRKMTIMKIEIREWECMSLLSSGDEKKEEKEKKSFQARRLCVVFILFVG